MGTQVSSSLEKCEMLKFIQVGCARTDDSDEQGVMRIREDFSALEQQQQHTAASEHIDFSKGEP